MSHDAHSNERLGDGHLAGQDFEPGLGHTMPVPTLNKVIAILVTLTVITVAASRVNFGHWNVIIALVIATIKAAIVVSFFMHLKFEGTTILMYVFYPLVVLFLFIGGSFVDVATRFDVRPVAVMEKLPQPVIAGGGHEEGHPVVKVVEEGKDHTEGGIDGSGHALGGQTPPNPDHATMEEDKKTHP
jgi:cytochrome c oxidase subunit 4